MEERKENWKLKMKMKTEKVKRIKWSNCIGGVMDGVGEKECMFMLFFSFFFVFCLYVILLDFGWFKREIFSLSLSQFVLFIYCFQQLQHKQKI